MATKTRDVLVAIGAYIQDHGYGPSIRDLQEIVGISSTSVAADCLRFLAMIGLVAHDAGIARSVRLTSAGREAIKEIQRGPPARAVA